LVLPWVLAACAEGIGFDDSEYTQSDGRVIAEASVPRQDSAVAAPDAGSVIPPSYDAGGGATQDASVPPVVDTGTSEEDAGSVAPTEDAGGTPPRDAGSDTGSPPMDAGPDTSTPSMDSGPEAGPVDTGGPSVPETSTNPNQCSTTPAYPTTTECAKCICAKCAAPVKQCYASGDATKDTNCGKVQECAEKNKCVDQSCYCTDTLSCLGTPNGPCVSVIESVAGTNNALDISRLGDDTSHPLGRAAAIGACEMSNCKSQCGL
jgi:hypothetical protein